MKPIALLVAAQLASAHFGVEYPEWRANLKSLERCRNTSAQDVIVAAATAQDAPLLDALLHGTETHDWIDRALTELSPEHRLVIELAYFLGLSCEEIAEIAGCPVGTVKTRMFYGRERLRQLLVTLAAPCSSAAAAAVGGSPA